MKRSYLLPIACMVLLTPLPALAHPGHGVFSFVSGLEHPISGADHLLAMFAVGLLAASRGGNAVWLWPVTFVSAMIAGAFVAFNGVALPFLEPVIALSVLVLGLAVALQRNAPVSVGCAVIAVFAVFHGNAHGLEAPVSAALPYITGFVLATALLHAMGLGFGLWMNNPSLRPVLRVAGTGMACAGLALLFL